MNTKIVGTIEKINPTVQVTEKFSKREVVINSGGDYPQQIMVQFSQEKCSIPEGYKLGDEVEISVNIRGRMWMSPTGEEKYFVSLDAWAMFKQGQGQGLPPSTGSGEKRHPSGLNGEMAQDHFDQGLQNELEDDDLPF